MYKNLQKKSYSRIFGYVLYEIVFRVYEMDRYPLFETRETRQSEPLSSYIQSDEDQVNHQIDTQQDTLQHAPCALLLGNQIGHAA